MLVLGIETSCDETGIGLLKNKKILANLIASQEDIHAVYGGIVPELASRAHASRIDNIFKLCLKKAGCKPEEIDFIGVTYQPGLKGSLLVGVSFAIGLGYSLGIPVYKINHLHAHLSANFLNPFLEFPAIGLVISGGHTEFFYLRDHLNFTSIGKTLDDACGETFDKVGRILGFGFPGGPIVEKEAKKGDENKIKFPITLLSKDSLNFSFSGIKTSVLYYVKKNGLKNKSDICASFQKAIGDVLIEKTKRVLKKYPVKSFLVGGGVIQNEYLRKRFQDFFKSQKIKFLFPPKNLCIDNGIMVSIFTYFLVKNKIPTPKLKIEVSPTI